ncbi:uncharacterized protein LOC119368470 [Triticum dicoccoides]|uniref:uncharacterized protein LOC119368470 n=1 Tax=Triticum dicoccoides TaxID=85692 RepID=UPI00188F59D9|nr:uncharacterized protein LOC119368470 [Triticum dicoccoides]XP_044320673.1 uncharacterized protein LOC123042247 [Triticum aestivum]
MDSTISRFQWIKSENIILEMEEVQLVFLEMTRKIIQGKRICCERVGCRRGRSPQWTHCSITKTQATVLLLMVERRSTAREAREKLRVKEGFTTRYKASRGLIFLEWKMISYWCL